MLSTAQIRAFRMRSLLLDGTSQSSVDGIVTWCGAMQAQDLSSALWSLGMRLDTPQGADAVVAADVEAALERGEALRTWPMRGTIHLVPSRDARWMLDVLGAKPLAGAVKRREYLGVTEESAHQAVEALETALSRSGRLSRTECIQVIEEAGVEVSGQVGYHLLWFAAQLGVTCIAPSVDGEQTFALLSEWAPDQVTLDREEALASIARRFVRSHGPVTVKDLARWTGLGVRDCRAGIAALGADIAQVTTEAGPMVMAAEALDLGPLRDRDEQWEWAIPPGFDEYMLGYADRSAFLTPDDFEKVVPGKNGVFRATLVHRGEVVATWKRILTAKACVVEVDTLRRLGVQDRRAAERAFTPYGTFVGQPAEVRWV